MDSPFIRKKFWSIFCLMCFVILSHAQNENKKWHFGAYAGLDFMTSPPNKDPDFIYCDI